MLFSCFLFSFPDKFLSWSLSNKWAKKQDVFLTKGLVCLMKSVFFSTCHYVLYWHSVSCRFWSDASFPSICQLRGWLISFSWTLWLLKSWINVWDIVHGVHHAWDLCCSPGAGPVVKCVLSCWPSFLWIFVQMSHILHPVQQRVLM